jgi:tetratricopeptide (TPR) repeat protein
MIAVHMTNREFPEALTLAEKNVEIDPNSAGTKADLAWVLLSNIQPDKSIDQFEKAMRLDPYYPPWYLNVMIRSYVLAGRYNEAKLAIQQQLQRSPGNFFNGQAHLNLAVVYSKLGEPEKAQAELAKAVEIWPKNTISFVKREVDCTDQTFVADYFQTLQQLGLPE